MTRRCEVCGERGRTRPMRDDRRHLHELEPGDGFVFPDTERGSRLLEVNSGRARIEEPGEPESVSFTTHEGQEVQFERPARTSRPCAPRALVVPL